MQDLKSRLEFHYKNFDRTKIEPDPIQFPHKFSNPADIEIMAFIASIFAFGKVNQINASLEKFVNISNNKPYDFIYYFNYRYKIDFQHRFYKSYDIQQLFILLNILLKKYKSLKNIFMVGYNRKHKNIRQAISQFAKLFLNTFEIKYQIVTNTMKFIFPIAENGSACKRMNLFLRWMVRKDDIDFGLWQEVPTNKLIIPLDTHIAKISQQLKLTNKKNVSWKMAEEITENLKQFDPSDPVKYDFALCHIGIRNLKF